MTKTKAYLSMNGGPEIDVTDMLGGIKIEGTDLHLVRIGLDLLDKAIKQAAKSFTVLGFDLAPIQTLEAQSGALRELYEARDFNEPMRVSHHLRRSLRLGIAIELDRVASLRDAQRDLLVPADDTETRLRQLAALLAYLDDQLSLGAP